MCPVCDRPLFLASGEVLSARYEILSLLGSGGMGTVYKAHDRILDETVALKVLRLDMARSAAIARRFRSEIKLARKVSHRNVCRIYEYGEDGRHVYLSMEFVDGVELGHRVRHRGLAPDEAFDVAIQVTKGLQAIHDVGIIHRDLKAANVICDSKGLVRLMDFGIAKRWIADGQIEGTKVGEIVGTPEYMSPEQARGHPVDFRSDIYSLGILLFETFTGQVPFQGPSAVDTLLMHIEEPPPLSGPMAKRLPRPVIPILRRALAKNAVDRYATARGITEALRLARGGADLEPRLRPSFFRRRPGRAPVAVLASPAAKANPPPTGNEELLEELLDEMSAEGAAREAATLRDPGLEQRVDDLVRELKQSDVRRRWRAAVALWELGPPASAAIEALSETLNDAAPIVARAAAEALDRITGKSVPRRQAAGSTTGPIDVSVLIGALGHDDVSVREWAAVALRDLGPAACEASPALLAALRDPNSGIRDWAALALASVCSDPAEVLPELLRALHDANMFLRAAAATALGALGAREAVPALSEALKDENSGVRCRAAVALGRIGSAARSAIPTLLKMIEDRDVSVADAAGLALEKIVARPDTAPVLQSVSPPWSPSSGTLDGRALVAVPVEDLPGPTGTEGVTPEAGPGRVELAPPPATTDAMGVRDLMSALSDGDAAVRWRAAAALGELGASARDAVRVLTDTLEDVDQTVRSAAAKALGKMGPAAKEAAPALAAALSDGDEVLRRAAAVALGAIGPEALVAVPALIRSFKSADLDEPELAIETLVKIGPRAVPALIDALIAALNEDDPTIRAKATAALTRVAAQL